MSKVCDVCATVYKDAQYDDFKIISHLQTCPKESCHGELHDVDDLLIYPYTQFVRRGYHPTICCSDHVRNEKESRYNANMVIEFDLEDDITKDNIDDYNSIAGFALSQFRCIQSTIISKLMSEKDASKNKKLIHHFSHIEIDSVVTKNNIVSTN